MIHSKMCLLHKLDPIKLSDFGNVLMIMEAIL